MKKFVYAGLILLGLSSAAYAGCTSTTLTQCPSPNYNSIKSGAYTDSAGNPMAGVWSGTGFGYTTPPSVAQMAASLSASPQPVTFAAITGTSLNVGTGAITGGSITGSNIYDSGNATIIGYENLTGALYPNGGIEGNTTGAAASSGYVGEIIPVNVSGVALAASTATLVASTSLTAGEYECSGRLNFGSISTNATVQEAYFALNGTAIAQSYNILSLGGSYIGSGISLVTSSGPFLVTTTQTFALYGYSTIATSAGIANFTCLRVR